MARPMTDLLTRLRAATGPDRALDIAYWVEVISPTTGIMSISPDMLEEIVPHYTASIDDALKLVPDGWRWWVGNNAHGTFDAQMFKEAGRSPIIDARAPTAPLAICIAAMECRDAP